MKRIVLILFILANCSMLLAQSAMSKLYKQWMIEDINNGKYEKAAEELTHVEDWSFDASDEKAYLDFNKALPFVEYLSSKGISRSLGDSLLIYIANDSYTCFRYYYSVGKYKDAIPYLELEQHMRKQAIGELHRDYVISISYLGIIYDKMGDYENAEKYYLKALEIQKELTGVNHSDYAACLHNISHLYYDMGDYPKAMQYGFQANELLKKILGENHPDYAVSLNTLGNLYHSMGDYPKAEKCYIQSLNIKTNSSDVEVASYTNSLSSLGALYSDMGDYEKAEMYYLKALETGYKDSDPEHYGTTLSNVGNLYSYMGNYSKAESFHLQAIDIYRSIFGENHPGYAIALGNLGSLYHTMGNYEKAEKCGQQALEICEIILGKSHPSYAKSLNNLGLVYQSMGNYDKAKTYYRQVLDLYENQLGDNHPDYAISLGNVAGLCHKIGDYAEAEKLYMRELEIQKNIIGEGHADYANTLVNLGLLYHSAGRYSEVEPLYIKAQRINADLFLKSIDFMSEKQRELYWEQMQILFEFTYPTFSYHYQHLKPSISSFAYDNELFIKGLLLTSSDNIRRSILESGDSLLINQWNELTTKKQQIAMFEEKDPESKYLEELRAEAEQLEKQITSSSAVFRQSKEQWNITWDSVRHHLGDNQVAIEYMVAPLNGDSTMYCALLMRDYSEYPEIIPLFEEKEVSALVNTTSENQTTFTYSFEGNGRTLQRLVWGKVLPHVKYGDTIYFAPSGILHQLAIEALPYDETHTMADEFNLVRLSSTREVVLRKGEARHSTATLYGGIQYNMTEDELLAESELYSGSEYFASRGMKNDSKDRGTIDYLKGSKKEVEYIDNLLKTCQLQVHLYTAKSANEESFKALNGKRENIIHIATHGFYWSESTAQEKDFFTQHHTIVNNTMPHLVVDPLNRCGLLFAGAQTAWSGHSANLPEGVQDGILTAKEISLLDLRDADLVVLSACETGKGEITGEGVFGLQRAFKMAGANTLIMSLWKVNDAATQLLMTEFYKNWLTKKQNKRTAFRNAQNTVRSRFEMPFYWAGFIMLD